MIQSLSPNTSTSNDVDIREILITFSQNITDDILQEFNEQAKFSLGFKNEVSDSVIQNIPTNYFDLSVKNNNQLSIKPAVSLKNYLDDVVSYGNRFSQFNYFYITIGNSLSIVTITSIFAYKVAKNQYYQQLESLVSPSSSPDETQPTDTSPSDSGNVSTSNNDLIFDMVKYQSEANGDYIFGDKDIENFYSIAIDTNRDDLKLSSTSILIKDLLNSKLNHLFNITFENKTIKFTPLEAPYNLTGKHLEINFLIAYNNNDQLLAIEKNKVYFDGKYELWGSLRNIKQYLSEYDDLSELDNHYILRMMLSVKFMVDDYIRTFDTNIEDDKALEHINALADFTTINNLIQKVIGGNQYIRSESFGDRSISYFKEGIETYSNLLTDIETKRRAAINSLRNFNLKNVGSVSAYSD